MLGRAIASGSTQRVGGGWREHHTSPNGQPTQLRSLRSFSTSTNHHGSSVHADTRSPGVASITLCRESLDFDCLTPYTLCHSAVLAWSLVGIVSRPAHHFHLAASVFHCRFRVHESS